MGFIENDIKVILTLRMEAIKGKIAQRMEAKRRTVTGRSVGSLAVVVQGMQAYLEGDPQWQVMQNGRAPGKGPYNFREIIKQWIDDRGIYVSPQGKQTEESAKNSLAFLISRSILEKGTSLYRNNGYSDIYDSVVEEEVKNMEKQTGAFFEAEVDKINNAFINDNKNDK